MLNGSEAGASEMMWICGALLSALAVTCTDDTSAHLADLELDVVNSARLDRLLRRLQSTLDEDDRLVMDALDPADHLLRDELRLDDDETLHGVRLLAEDNKDHLGT